MTTYKSIKIHHSRRKPIWQIKKEMKQLQLELELLKKDPGTNHDEISDIDSRLSSLKTEYFQRKFEIAQSIKPKGAAT